MVANLEATIEDLYAVPGKEPFYRKFGFLRMKTAMAIFDNQQQQLERGYLTSE